MPPAGATLGLRVAMMQASRLRQVVSGNMQKRALHRIFLAVFLLLVAVPLLGCNTMEGLGKDIQAAGRVLENTADRDN